MDSQKKSIIDEIMDTTQKVPENMPPEDFEMLINKKIDEIEALLVENHADNRKIGEVHRHLEEAFLLSTEKEILTAVEQLSAETEKEYVKKQKNISEDAKHFLADIENIPQLKTKTLQKIAEDHKINPNGSVKEIIQKLRDIRDGGMETKKTEPVSSEGYSVAKEEDDSLKKMRTDHVFLREKIKGEETQTPKDPETIKRLNSELLELDKRIKKEETTETEQEQIVKVKEKIENVLSLKKPEEKSETITPKTAVKEVKPKKNTNAGFLWLKNILSHKEGLKNTKQTNTSVAHTPTTEVPFIKEVLPLPIKQENMSVTEEILQQGKEISQIKPESESSLQKFNESYQIKEGDTIRKIMEMHLVKNKTFNNLTSRQKNFLLDSTEETFKKSRIPIIPGKTLDLDTLFKENKDIARILKKE